MTGEHLCRACPNCGYGWAESCTVVGAAAYAALAPSPGCGMSLVSLAAGLLSGGVGFLLSVLLGGAALAGAWLAVTVTVSAGAGLASRVSPATSYWSGVFEPMLLIGIGMGVVFVPLTTVSLAGVRREDSGAASSMVNVMQQVGGSLGLVLVAVYGTATRNAAAHPAAGLSGVALQHHVLAHGMSTAFGLAAIFDVAVLVLVVTLLRPRKQAVPDTPAGLVNDEVAANAIGE